MKGIGEMVLASVVVSSSADAGCVRPPLLWAGPLFSDADAIIADVVIELVLTADVNMVRVRAGINDRQNPGRIQSSRD